MTTDELQALHDELWAFRAEMDATSDWKTPQSALDSLRFAATEAGEALDAWLRLKGGYARNNDKSLSVEAELADCAMMLMTAMGPGQIAWQAECWIFDTDPTLEQIMNHTACALELACINWTNTSALYTQSALHAIASYPGLDLPAELRARMARIRRKHGRADA